MFNVHMTSTTMELVPLACLCLVTWSGTTFADGNDPRVTVAEGSDAILPCSFSSNIERLVFDWKKDGVKEVFLYVDGKYYGNGRTGQDKDFERRVLHFKDELKNGNASIKILNTKITDSGNYSCTFPPQQDSVVTLVVDPDPERFILKDRTEEKIPGASPEPSVTNLDESKDWSLLRCVVRGAFPQPDVQWQDSSGNTLTAEEPQVTRNGERYDVILNVTVTKTDRYHCVSTQKEIKHQIKAGIYVRLYGAASKPSVTNLGQTKDGQLLQCEVHGASPRPKVFWQDSDKNLVPAKEPQVSERGGSYDIILQTTVTKTDHYRCVATQEEINHETHAQIYVSVHGSSVGWIVGTVVLAVILLLVGLVLIVLRSKGYICIKGPETKTRVPTDDSTQSV